MESAGVIKLLTRKKAIIGKLGGLKIALEGQEYSIDIDKDPSNYDKKVQADYNILFAHGMLQPKPILDKITHTLITDIPNPADITFCGHDHVGWDIVEYKGKYFLNPGSVGRVDCSQGMKGHVPSVIVLEIEVADGQPNIGLNRIAIPCVKPFEDVFASTNQNTNKDSFSNFVQAIQNSSINNKVDQLSFVDGLVADGTITKDIAVISKQYIEEAKKLVNANNVVAYNKLNNNIYIESLELKNFLAHKDSKVSFTNGFNAILGPNGAGKTSLLTALNWVFYDKPTGSDFVRTGATSCEVKVNFSNGTYIRKTRNKTSGTYYVFDGTKEEVFKGYGNNLPTAIVDAHQMPLVNLYKDKFISLNYGNQLDGLFLVNASSGEKAEALGKLTGADIIDGAIETSSKDLKREKAIAKDLDKNIEILTKDRVKLEIEIADLNTHLDRAKQLYNRIKLLHGICENYNKLEKDNLVLQTLKVDKNLLNNKAKTYKDIKDVSNLLKIFDAYISFVKTIGVIQEDIKSRNNYRNILKRCNDVNIMKDIDVSSIKSYYELISLEEELNYLKDRKSLIDNKTKDFPKEVKGIDIVSLFNIYSSEKLLLDKLLVREEHLQSLLKEEEYKINTFDEALKRCEKRLHENGVCPTCNRVLDEKSIEYIMKKEK